MADRAVWQRTIVDERGNIIPGAEVTVRSYPDGSLVTLYESPEGALKSNPFVTGHDGFARFWADSQRVEIIAIGAGGSIRWIVDLLNADEVIGDAVSEATAAAAVAVGEAEAAADRAEAARDAAQLSAGIYEDTAAGLAATTDGDYFSVPSEDDDEYLILYRNDSGSATEVRRYPSTRKVSSLDHERVNFYDHRDLLLPTNLPADQEAIARTKDGYAVIYRDGEDILVGGVRAGTTSGQLTASDSNLTAAEDFAVRTKDKHLLLGMDGDAFRVGSATFGLNGEDAAFAGLRFAEPGGPFAILTADRYPVLAQDPETGFLSLALSPERYVQPGSRNLLDGTIQPGTVTNIHAMGEWFGYHVHGSAYSGPVIGRRMGDWASPHLPLCDEIEVWEADGQSWQTISDYTADEIDIEELSGATGDAVRAAVTPMVSLLRKANFLDSPQDDEDYIAIVPTISNGAMAGELARFRPDWRYSTAQMAAACAVHHRGKLGTDNPPIVILGVGWPGTGYRFFLPEGSSISYTDRDGNPQTVNAEEHPNAGAYLWANSTARRDSVISTVATRWPGRSLLWRTLSWIQGVPDDDNEYAAFMAEYRAQQDALGLGTRDILWDQNGGTTRRVIQPWGIQAQLEFCQANASGHDWLVGPRYPHRLRDYIHHSSFGALEYAERTGQAKAYVDRYGEWEPLWITDVQFNGSDVVLTINRPRQTIGDLLVDDETIPAAPNHGFTLWDATSDVEIPIEGVAVGADTITLTTGSTLSGSIEVGYAVRGSQNPDGTPESPQLSATVGNIKRKGRDAPAIIPQSVQPTLDHWLCQYRKIHEV